MSPHHLKLILKHTKELSHIILREDDKQYSKECYGKLSQKIEDLIIKFMIDDIDLDANKLEILRDQKFIDQHDFDSIKKLLDFRSIEKQYKTKNHNKLANNKPK